MATPVTLAPSALLEEAARAMTNAEVNRANVVDPAGSIIGHVTLAKTVAEMIAPDPSEDDEVADPGVTAA